MQSDYEELFRQAKELIKPELTSIAYDTWILPLKIVDMTEDNIVLKSRSSYNIDILKGKYGDLIINTFKYLTNKERTLTIIFDDENAKTEVKNEILPSSQEDEGEIDLSNKSLNEYIKFIKFVFLI